MSLLVKALEQAARERDRAPTASNAAAPLTLEPLRTTASSERKDPVPSSPAPRARAASAATSTSQAQAAFVLAASDSAGGSALLEWFKARPVYAIGAAAAVFLLGYGAYVYVQIAHPALLRRTPPRPAPTAATPPATTPAPAAVATAAPPPTPPGERAEPDDAPPAATTPATVTASPAAPAVAAAPPALDAGSRAPARDSGVRDSGVISRAPTPAPSASAQFVPEAAPRLLPSQQQRVAVARADEAQPRVLPAVAQAWTALQAGDHGNARHLYETALRVEPANVDAHLGLAAIAQAEGRPGDAQRHYAAILDADPRNTLAQNGLIALGGHADPQTAEARLKQLIAREPSAPLYFSLGNLYADQGLWRDAQQAYFQAHHLDARNADYAYNLAVGLEHLAQPRIALDFYRKAVELAAAAGAANFDIARAQQRIRRLSGASN
jgi:tetratricopeptide (TPR) repeat protein